MKLYCPDRESSEWLATKSCKSAQETGTNEAVVSVKGDVKEKNKEQPCLYITKCVERTVAKPEHTLGIIDGVSTTSECYMGTLA